MSKKLLMPLCAAAVLLAACDHSDNSNTPAASTSGTSDSPTAPGDTSTTPGGTAGEANVPPTETQPSDPPPSGGQ